MIGSALQQQRLLITVLAVIAMLAGCSAASTQPAAQPLQSLPPPPSAADLDRIAGEVGNWIQTTLPGEGAAPAQQSGPYALGRPSRVALLDRDTIFQFAPDQSMQAQLRPTGGWLVPVYQGRQLVALAELDATYTIVGVSTYNPAQQPPPSIIAAYDDPVAEVWYVPFQGYPAMLLLLRPSGEQMALFENAPSPLYPSLAALGGQELAPDELLQTLEQAVTERCRVLWLFWQC